MRHRPSMHRWRTPEHAAPSYRNLLRLGFTEAYMRDNYVVTLPVRTWGDLGPSATRAQRGRAAWNSCVSRCGAVRGSNSAATKLTPPAAARYTAGASGAPLRA